MERSIMVKGLIPIIGDSQLLLRFRKNVIYPILQEIDTNKIMAMIIDVNGRQTFTPNNETAAVLLYLLARDESDPVLLSDYLYFITVTKEKYVGKEAEIKAFMEKLDTTYKLLQITVVPEGTQGATDLDPVGLLDTVGEWEDPDLTRGKPPICKSKTFYSLGGYNPGIGPVPIIR